MKNTVYINVGNTNIVFAYSKTNKIRNLVFHKISTSEFKDDNKRKKLFNNVLSRIEKEIKVKMVYASSVVTSVEKELVVLLKSKKIKSKFISSNDVDFIDLSNLYNQYELGVDILAQSCYISNFFDEAIVVSAGTATVIYHITKKKISGVIIIPGIMTSLSTLVNKTGIQNVKIKNTSNILGLNTSESVSIGLIKTVENFVSQIKQKFETDCPVICCGGDSKYFKNKNWWYLENLEILGLFTINNLKKTKKL